MLWALDEMKGIEEERKIKDAWRGYEHVQYKIQTSCANENKVTVVTSVFLTSHFKFQSWLKMNMITSRIY